jgi:Bifunctional DNA primase/polymerase, N-terminal
MNSFYANLGEQSNFDDSNLQASGFENKDLGNKELGIGFNESQESALIDSNSIISRKVDAIRDNLEALTFEDCLKLDELTSNWYGDYSKEPDFKGINLKEWYSACHSVRLKSMYTKGTEEYYKRVKERFIERLLKTANDKEEINRYETARKYLGFSNEGKKAKGKSKSEWQKHVDTRADEIAASMDLIPEEWVLMPVNNKKPLFDEWQKGEFPRERIKNLILKGEEAKSKKGYTFTKVANSYGIITGDLSEGILALDADCQGAKDFADRKDIEETGSVIKTVSSTSGKAGREQRFYRVPEELRDLLSNIFVNETIQFEGGELDFRYNRKFSVLPPGVHPETGSYRWINSPEECELATLPKWACEIVLAKFLQEKTKARLIAPVSVTEDDLKLVPNVKISPASDAGYLGRWYAEKQADTSPVTLFNSPLHNWQNKGSYFKGLPGWYEPNPGLSCTVKLDPKGIWWVKDHWDGGKKPMDAVFYEWHINLGMPAVYPKGSDYITALKSLAKRCGWGELPEKATDVFNREVEAIQNALNGLHIEGATIIEVEGKHIDSTKVSGSLFGFERALVFISARISRGKTYTAAEICKEKSVTGVTPTNALGLSMTAKDGIAGTMREEAKLKDSSSFEYQKALYESIEKLLLCYPSLFWVKDRHADVLLLDEIKAGLKMLFTSSLCNKNNNRPKLIKAFIALLKQHKYIYAADAFLDQTTVDFIREILPDIPIIWIKEKENPEIKSREVYYASMDYLENKILADILAGNKVTIASDSKDSIRALEKKYAELGFNITFAVYSEVVSDKECQKFLKAPTEYLNENENVQILLYSPTIVAGVSINRDFGCIYGINTHIEAPDFVQMLGRVRTEFPIYYTVSNGGDYKGCKSFIPYEQKVSLTKRSDSLMDSFGTTLQEDLTRDLACKFDKYVRDSYLSNMLAITELAEDKESQLIIDTTAKLRAVAAYNSINRRERVHYFLKKTGYKVKFLINEQQVNNTDIPALEKLGYEVIIADSSYFTDTERKKTAEIKKEILFNDAENIINSPCPSKEEYEALKEKQNCTIKEKNLKEKYRLTENYPEFKEFIEDKKSNEVDEITDLTQAYFELFIKDKGNLPRAVDSYVKLLNLDEFCKKAMKKAGFHIKAMTEENLLTTQDVDSTYDKLHFLKNNCKILEIINWEGDEKYSATDLKEIVDSYLIKNAKKFTKLKEFFRITKFSTKRDGYATQLLNKILGEFGHKLLLEKTIRGINYYSVQKLQPINKPGLWDYMFRVKLNALSKKDEKTENPYKPYKVSEAEKITSVNAPIETEIPFNWSLGNCYEIDQKTVNDVAVRTVARQYINNIETCQNEELLNKAMNLLEALEHENLREYIRAVDPLLVREHDDFRLLAA